MFSNRRNINFSSFSNLLLSQYNPINVFTIICRCNGFLVRGALGNRWPFFLINFSSSISVVFCIWRSMNLTSFSDLVALLLNSVHRGNNLRLQSYFWLERTFNLRKFEKLITIFVNNLFIILLDFKYRFIGW